jgi:hypothetical protein
VDIYIYLRIFFLLAFKRIHLQRKYRTWIRLDHQLLWIWTQNSRASFGRTEKWSTQIHGTRLPWSSDPMERQSWRKLQQAIPNPSGKNMKNIRKKMQQQTDIAGGDISTSISSIIVRQGTSV